MPSYFEFLRRRPDHAVLLGGSALALVMVCLHAANEIESWNRARRNTELSVANLTLVTEQEVTSTLQIIDVSLKVIAELTELFPGRQLDAPAVGAVMKERRKDLPFVYQIAIFDSDGYTAQSTDDIPISTAITAADRDYFAAHRDDPARGLVFGTPIVGRTTQRLMIPISRRIAGSDGKFAGAVVAFTDLQKMAEVYDKIDVGPGGAIGIVRGDGTVLARFPYREDTIGSSRRDTLLFRELLPKSRAGLVMGTGAVDGVIRLFSYRALADFPIVVYVGIDWGRIRREELPSILIDFGVSAAVLVVLGLAALLFARAMHRQQKLLEERGISEQRARESETDIRALIDTLPVGISYTTADGSVLAVNPAWRRMYGFGETDALAEINASELWADPSDRDRWLKQLAQHGFVGRAEKLRRRRDGTEFWVELHVSGITDAINQLQRLRSVHIDIIDRKQREKIASDYRESEQFLRAILDHTGDAVICIDERGLVTVYNSMAEAIFGYAADEVLGKNVNMLMPEPDRTRHDGYIKSYLETGVAKIIGSGREVRGCRKDGTVFPLGLTVTETAVGGKRGFVGTLRDLTETKRLQEQLLQALKMEAVGQLTGGIAHDFNNLLTVVMGNAETLSEALADNPRLKHLVEMISTAANRGADLTKSLLVFSRKQTLAPKITDINGLVSGMKGLLRRTLGEQIEVKMRLAKDLRAVMTDTVHLESVVLNLCLNARDAMPKGGRLTIEASNAELTEDYTRQEKEVVPGSYVMIAISDTGTGMAPEVLAKAFDPFFTTKEVGKGSGLGLSMVYGFIKQSKGHIKIYSEPGIGTTIKLYLPVANTGADIPGVATSDPVEITGGSETILVVEDDDMVRGYAESVLDSLGYRVLSSRDGQAALTVLRQGQKVDLMFTDIVMPGGMNGYQLADEARRLRPALRILFTSGYTAGVLELENMANPDIDLLSKPYLRHELAARLRKALNARSGSS